MSRRTLTGLLGAARARVLGPAPARRPGSFAPTAPGRYLAVALPCEPGCTALYRVIDTDDTNRAQYRGCMVCQACGTVWRPERPR